MSWANRCLSWGGLPLPAGYSKSRSRPSNWRWRRNSMLVEMNSDRLSTSASIAVILATPKFQPPTANSVLTPGWCRRFMSLNLAYLRPFDTERHSTQGAPPQKKNPAHFFCTPYNYTKYWPIFRTSFTVRIRRIFVIILSLKIPPHLMIVCRYANLWNVNVLKSVKIFGPRPPIYCKIARTRAVRRRRHFDDAAAADRNWSARRRRRYRDVFTSCCTPAICC